MTDNVVDIKSYLVSFVVIYFIGVVLGHVLTQLFSISASSGISATILFISAYATVAKFIDQNNRVPNDSEKWRLIGGSLALAWMASIVALCAIAFAFGGNAGVSALANLIGGMSIAAWAVVVTLLSSLYLVVLYAVYGWSAKKILERRQLKPPV